MYYAIYSEQNNTVDSNYVQCITDDEGVAKLFSNTKVTQASNYVELRAIDFEQIKLECEELFGVNVVFSTAFSENNIVKAENVYVSIELLFNLSTLELYKLETSTLCVKRCGCGTVAYTIQFTAVYSIQIPIDYFNKYDYDLSKLEQEVRQYDFVKTEDEKYAICKAIILKAFDDIEIHEINY